MKYLILVISVLFSCGLAAEEYISVALEKNTYTTKDSFIAKLNGLNDSPVQYIGLSIEVRQNESWVTVRRDTGCPRMAKCKKKATEIIKGQTIEEHWDFKDTTCKVVTSGFYRAVITGNYITALGGNQILGTSHEFQIK